MSFKPGFCLFCCVVASFSVGMEIQCDLGINGARYRNFDVIRNADIEIILDDEEGEFHAGFNTITGKVAINIRNNLIEFQGEGELREKFEF